MKLELLKKYRNDIILIVVVIAVAISGWLFFELNKTEGGSAVVVIDGKEYASYPLDTDIEVTIKNGEEYNVLIINDGKAYIKDASCPDKLCVKQHAAEFNGETLVCLPNKISVKIVSETESEIDFIS